MVHEGIYRCVNSVITQTYQPLEIILVNDACENELVFENFISTDIKIIKIDLSINSGPATARNIGLKASKGTYIAFLDSDDYWGLDKLKSQVTSIRKYGLDDGILVVSPVTIVRGHEILGYRYPLLKTRDGHKSQYFKGPFLSLGSTAFFSANLFKQVGGQNPKLRIYEDFEWQIRMVRDFNIKFICSDQPNVFIEKSKRTINKSDLKTNFLELFSCIKNKPRTNFYLYRYITAGYYLDIAVSEFNQRNFVSFIFNFSISFLIVPRLTLHLSKFWQRCKSI